MEKPDKIPENCPHCGKKLSPWEQILLSVDRALMCRGCWYRILLDHNDNPKTEPPKKYPPKKDDET